ncbi:amino acid ABC transporter permease [Candidatus Acetothermia bacterium]|nr:amino acid ABC transporter permease [Candidatus Acetothermia bacterium]
MSWETLCQNFAEDSFWRLACDSVPKISQGTLLTIEITFAAIAIGFVFGLLLALGRVYGNRPIYALCSGYVHFVRGTPLLVQLLIIYYGLPSFEIRLDPVLAGIIGLGINSAAYQAEYFRGAIQSIRAGQMQAALAIGMSRPQAIRSIILPQALRLVIPPWSNELIYTLKYSSAVSFLAVDELYWTGHHIAVKTYRYFDVYLIIAFIYLALVLILTKIIDKIEDRLRIPGLEIKH